MKKETKKIIKILKLINAIFSNYEETHPDNPGRKPKCSEMTLFKIFVIMKLTNTKTIKGIWRLIMKNKHYKKLCKLEDDISRSTLSRALSDKLDAWNE